MLFDGLDGRQEALAIEAIGIELPGRLVGGGDHGNALLEHRPQQASEQHGVTDVVDEQLVEAEHPDLFRQFTGQRPQRVRRAGELEQPLVHPAHEVMEVLTPGRDLEALVEAIHQPGLAAPHRAPEVNAGRLASTVQRLMTGLQAIHGMALGRLRLEPALLQGMAVGGKRGFESHGAALCGLGHGKQGYRPIDCSDCGGDFNR
ncbi:hypothetical protein D9M73_187270 [compost metagenome]